MATEPTKEPSETGLYIVRLFDGFDYEWMDVTEALPWEKAVEVWNNHTENGTKKTSYNDIDYYRIFPSSTRMRFGARSPT